MVNKLQEWVDKECELSKKKREDWQESENWIPVPVESITINDFIFYGPIIMTGEKFLEADWSGVTYVLKLKDPTSLRKRIDVAD